MLTKARAKGIPWPAPSFFTSRPLLCGAVCYAAGVALSGRVGYSRWLWVFTAVSAALGLCATRLSARTAKRLLLLALCALGLTRGGMELAVPNLPRTGRWTAEGTVAGAVRHTGSGAMFYLGDLWITDAEGAQSAVDSNLYVYYPTAAALPLRNGQRVRVEGTGYLPSGRRNPGGFDQRMWLAQSGAHIRLYASSAPKVLAAAGWSPRGIAIAVSDALGARLDRVFGGASPIVRAMLLGEQDAVPDTWRDWMTDSGIVHLLAVSGLHVGLWYLLLGYALRLLPVSPRTRWWLLCALLFVYAMVTGLKASVLRASIMLLALGGGQVVRRKVDPLTSLSLAALLILLVRPLDLFSAGFQLSFLAVLGIALLRPALQRLLGFLPGRAREPVGMTLAAQLGSLPTAAYWFGRVSVVGILTNLVAVPLAGLLIPAAAAGTALEAVWAPLGWPLVEAVKGMAALLLLLSRAGAWVPFGVARVGAFAWWTAAWYGACLLLCSTAVVWRWRTRAVAMGTAFLVVLCFGYADGYFTGVRYVQLDVGQALSGVLHVGAKAYVYDCGEENNDLTEYLLYTGASVEAVFLSHPHSDHTGGLSELLEAGIAVKTVYVPANATAFGAESGYAGRLALAEENGAAVVALQAGDVLDLGGVTATVIAPDREPLRGNDPNDRSLVLLMKAGNHALLLMGDADGAAEPLGIDCDVLQVAHHGSQAAAGEAFLLDATPDIALISTGRNSYGHPHADTLRRLAEAGADIYSTQESGALTVYFERDDIRVEAYIP